MSEVFLQLSDGEQLEISRALGPDLGFSPAELRDGADLRLGRIPNP